MKKSIKQIICTAIAAVAMAGLANADTLAVWSFDSGGTSAERLAASNTFSGAVASGLTMNTDAGGYGFDDVGPGAVPNSVHDGYGFGGAGGEQVMFTHRANYFDGSPISPSNKPSASDYTSFGPGDGGGVPQGTTAGLGDGNAPIFFTVSAFLGNEVTVSNLTMACATGNPGATLIIGVQEAGEAAGTMVTLNAGSGWMGTAELDTPVVIEAGKTKTFTINLNSGTLNSGHNINFIELGGSVTATGASAIAIAEWNFDTGSTSSNRLLATVLTNGAVVSGLTMNTDGGGFGFRDAGNNAVPNNEHDGYGFGGNSGELTMFLHRANYFDASAVPDPRPTADDYTSFGIGEGGSGPQGTTAGLGNGNAPVFFTVTAETGKVVIVESITCHKVGGDAFIFGMQEAGETAGATVTLTSGNQTDTATLNAPLVLEDGESKTFTMNWNSGTLNSAHILNEFVINGAVEDYVEATVYEIWADYYGLTGDDTNLTADLEYGGLGDGMDNLMEYALGGNPTEDDAASVLPKSGVDGGWFYYIHTEREDDDSLTYNVLLTDNLVTTGWITNGMDSVGESDLDAFGYKSVTNRTDTGSQEFVTLQVEKD